MEQQTRYYTSGASIKLHVNIEIYRFINRWSKHLLLPTNATGILLEQCDLNVGWWEARGMQWEFQIHMTDAAAPRESDLKHMLIPCCAGNNRKFMSVVLTGQLTCWKQRQYFLTSTKTGKNKDKNNTVHSNHVCTRPVVSTAMQRRIPIFWEWHCVAGVVVHDF